MKRKKHFTKLILLLKCHPPILPFHCHHDGTKPCQLKKTIPLMSSPPALPPFLSLLRRRCRHRQVLLPKLRFCQAAASAAKLATATAATAATAALPLPTLPTRCQRRQHRTLSKPPPPLPSWPPQFCRRRHRCLCFRRHHRRCHRRSFCRQRHAITDFS